MIIFAAGMRRAGSTVIFNIARELVEYFKIGRGLTIGEHYEEEILKHFKSPEYIVVKQHFLNPSYLKYVDHYSYVLMSVRDIREICCSIIRLGMCDFDGSIKYLDDYIKEQQTWNFVKHALVRKYEVWVNDLANEIIEIGTYLGLTVDQELADHLSEKWSIESSKLISDKVAGTHPVNFLNPGHITSGATRAWREELNEEQIALLTNRYKEWLKRYDYPY